MRDKHMHAGEEFAPSNYYAAYVIDDAESGAKVTVSLTDTTRDIYSNGLPSFETGEFPVDANPNTISEQNTTISLPLVPVYHGQAGFARTSGITVSGFHMTPGTAERAYCDNDVEFNIEVRSGFIMHISYKQSRVLLCCES